MKKQFFLLGAAAVFAFGSCNNSSDSKSANGDSTTTTTTTSKVGSRIANFENRSFLNLKTGQPVKLMYDTVNHYYVDAATNQQPNYLYFDPSAHDTFDYLGRNLDHALIINNGDYAIDESKVMAVDNTVAPKTDSMNSVAVDTSTTTTITSTTTSSNGKTKTKQKDDKTKTKTKTDK